MCESIEKTEALIVHHLQQNGLYDENASWSIKNSTLGGRGIFASKDIFPGEIIFVDTPLILGPRAGKQIQVICVNCFANVNLKPCSNGCGLPICSHSCENSQKHQKECRMILNWKKTKTFEIDSTLHRVLCAIRSLFLEESSKELAECLLYHSDHHHGFEVDLIKEQLKLDISEEEENFMRTMCAVMDANAFEVIVGNEEHQSSLRGLYPLGSMANHNCLPNTMHCFDRHQRMLTKATVFIPKDQEIFHSYCRIIWSTPTRRYHLKRTKNFWCSCKRCTDPTEFGSFIGGFCCEQCGGNVVAEKPLKMNSDWICLACYRKITGKKMGFLISMLGSRLGSVRDVDEMLEFLDGPVQKIVLPTNQIAVELKYKLIWTLGYSKNYRLEELSEELLMKKIVFCEELLHLLETMGVGKCKMRGLLLYELYICLKETQKRIGGEDLNNNFTSSTDDLKKMRAVLEECCEILKDDVGAPDEIKELLVKLYYLK